MLHSKARSSHFGHINVAKSPPGCSGYRGELNHARVIIGQLPCSAAFASIFRRPDGPSCLPGLLDHCSRTHLLHSDEPDGPGTRQRGTANHQEHAGRSPAYPGIALH